MKNMKKRNWAFVLYPESAPENWKELLQQTGLGIAISPLHNKDINPTGEVKKAHYHIILTYDGPTTYNNVRSLTESLGQPIPQPLEQVRGYYRYLTHKDNPEKAQYDDKDIITYNGFNIQDFVELTTSEVMAIKKQLQIFIRDNHITEYSLLMDLLLDNEMSSMYEVASNHTYFLDKYITSYRNKLNNLTKLKN